MISTEIYELAAALYESDGGGSSFQAAVDADDAGAWFERAHKVAAMLLQNGVTLQWS